MKITTDDYFRAYTDHPEIVPAIEAAAARMLDAVNELLAIAEAEGVPLRINPATTTLVSGQDNGGFRPRACPIGAVSSNHKTGHAVDVYDPAGALGAWISTFDAAGGADNAMLASHGLYREHPDATRTWCHLQDLPPRSGRRTFFP